VAWLLASGPTSVPSRVPRWLGRAPDEGRAGSSLFKAPATAVRVSAVGLWGCTHFDNSRQPRSPGRVACQPLWPCRCPPPSRPSQWQPSTADWRKHGSKTGLQWLALRRLRRWCGRMVSQMEALRSGPRQWN